MKTCMNFLIKNCTVLLSQEILTNSRHFTAIPVRKTFEIKQRLYITKLHTQQHGCLNKNHLNYTVLHSQRF